MYEIATRDAYGFVTDPNIDLPRFQRASTWNRPQRFNLAISAFHGYPLGMVVVRQQDMTKEGKRKKVSYLLDGRQRRETLQLMRNPEEMWRWARAALKFNLGDTRDEIAPKFWAYIDDYFGREDWQEQDEGRRPETDEDFDADGGAEESGVPGDGEINEEVADKRLISPDLEELLDVILSVHPAHGTKHLLPRLFNFSKHVAGLPYLEGGEGATGDVSVPKLLFWIQTLRGSLEVASKSYPPNKTDLLEQLIASGRDVRTSKEDLARAIDVVYEDLLRVLNAVDAIDARLRGCDLGYLEIKDCTANDEKKIFEIINSAGTQLSAVEILSAKHQWNIRVEDPGGTIRADARRLYIDALGMNREVDDVVRWDVAATVLDRLDIEPVIRSGHGFENLSKGQFEGRVTLGFKLLAGRYLRRIAKDDLSELGKLQSVPWHAGEFEEIANQVHQILEAHSGFYRFWASWNTSLNQRTSDAAAMNFVLLCVENWISRGQPIAKGSERSAFVRESRTLLDRTIYEYVTDAWRGSSDSKIARNLKRFVIDSDRAVFSPPDPASWRTLISEVVDGASINGDSYLSATAASADPRVILLILYSYIVQSRGGPDRLWTVDHIVPRHLFRAASPNLKLQQHHIANLALIPQGDNLLKSDDSLATIAGYAAGMEKDWLVQQITKYTDIQFEDFASYSRASQLADLQAFRGPLLIEALTTTREQAVNAEG